MSKSKRFHEIEVGQKFQRDERGPVYTKVNKSIAGIGEDGPLYPINSQALVTVIEEQQEVHWKDLDFHTFDFTETQRDAVISEIIDRSVRDYGYRINIDVDRLRNGILCAHRVKPIRLIALLNSCMLDFPTDVIQGIYRHYDPNTDTIRGGWTAQHAEPHRKSWWE